MINDGIQFTNQSTGMIDEYNYSFGDGIFSSSENPFHVYPESGTYEACLQVRQEEFSCELEYCDSVQVVISSLGNINEIDFNIYPNPLTENVHELFIEYAGNFELKKSSIQLINTNGTPVQISEFSKIGSHSYSIKLNDQLAKGIYFIIVSENNMSISRKVVVF